MATVIEGLAEYLKRMMESFENSCNDVTFLGFGKGQHHNNKPVCDLVDALYRYIGFSPDSPGLFEGFYDDSKENAFAVSELNVEFSPDTFEGGKGTLQRKQVTS